MENSNIRLIPIGFWREHCGDMFSSIFDAPVEHLDSSDVEGICRYLSESPICVASPGIVKSVFGADKRAGTSSNRTDGKWLWHDTLSYYVREHHISLPPEFVEFIRHQSYKPPREDQINLGELIFPW